NGLAKLAEWEVAEIKYLLAKGIPQAKLARLFDVSRSVVNEVAAAWQSVRGKPRATARELRQALIDGNRLLWELPLPE
ncbi:hypothetical protein LCGC14_2658470, partial [marine sediment metagenome]